LYLKKKEFEMDEKNVWTEFVSAKRARDVARALKAAGYKSATIEKSRGYVINVARYFEPSDQQAREIVLTIIAQAAGIQPRRSQ
jgi:hypothetical protein